MAKNGIVVNGGDDASDIPVPKSRIPKGPSKKELQSEENQKLLRHIEDLWIEARDAAAENRREQMIDADFYDHIQWTIEDSQVLMERGQAPLVFNIVKQACDWILGTERRTRVDWKVFPRNDQDEEGAVAKTALLKYVSDVNGLGWQRSAQFKDTTLVGVGWMENTVRSDVFDDPLLARKVDWKQMWWDPYSRDDDLNHDCRALHRAKWIDEDYAVAMFPKYADEIRKASTQFLDSELELFEDWNDLPMVFTNMDRYGRQTQYGRMMGTMSFQRRARKRVRLIETWYKRPVARKKMWASTNSDSYSFDGVFFDEKDAAHVDAVKRQVVSLTDAVTENLWCAIWIKGVFLSNTQSPFKHKKYPYTPCWAFRRHRDGMPYGVIRGQRDPQEDLNKRRSKALFILSSRSIQYENGAIDEADEDETLDEVSKPNGQMRFAKGALEKGKVKIENNTELADAHVKMADSDIDQIFQVGGVTRENLGQDTSAASGRAIVAKQQQGAVTTAELFDNLRRSIQLSGQIALSNIEQYMPMPKQFRITGGNGVAEFQKVNWPQQNPTTGEWEFTNDITKSEADFIVDEQDYSATYRMQLAQEIFELLSNIAQTNPQAAFALLDMAVDMTDLPNKEEFVKRVRMLNGQQGAGEKPTPEQQAAQQAQQQQQQQAQQDQQTSTQLSFSKLQAEIDLLKGQLIKVQSEAEATKAKAGLTVAQTDNTDAQTAKTGVDTKHAAIKAATDLHAAAPLAPAADKLLGPPPPRTHPPRPTPIIQEPGNQNGRAGTQPPINPVNSGSDIGSGEPPFAVRQP